MSVLIAIKLLLWRRRALIRAYSPPNGALYKQIKFIF